MQIPYLYGYMIFQTLLMNLDDMKKCTISEHLIQVSNIQTMKKGTTQMSALEVSFKFPL